jgi:formate/nitrite transporter FocA (FNT family)
MKAKLEKAETSPAVAKTISTRAEQTQVEERATIGANVVYEVIRREGEEELRRPPAALAWSGFAAGLSMGFSFVAEALLTSYLPDRPWLPLLTKAGYSIGFLVVILGRQQLFTENTLTVILPLLLNKNVKTLLRVLRLWGIVLAANLVGTLLFALCVAHLPVFDAHTRQTMAAIAASHLGRSFGTVLMRAIFAGWLIALMVWLLPAAEHSRVAVIIILTYLVGLGGLAHIVAGSTVMFFAVATGTLSWAGYALNFFLPTLIGNILGGVSLVAALAHGQVVGGKET